MTFFALLGLLFIALKLMHFISWSWWIVLLPLYGGLVFATVMFVFATLTLAAAKAILKK